MDVDNGTLNFKITLDNSQLASDGAKSINIFKGIGDAATAQGARLDNVFKQAGKSAGIFGNDMASLQQNILALASIATLGRLGKEIITIRGEFQQLGIAFETMLGSKEKADKLMQDAIAFSQKTPYTLLDTTASIKQLMAMGVESQNVMGTIKSLGDVASGVSVPISRIAINYGQVLSLGKLQGRELRDFAMAGVPLLDELAKNMGKTKSEITDMITASQIGFPEVEKAFQTMSGEGGKFYNLMEKQNASVTGQISNLTDKWQVMLNAIGKSNEGLIYGGVAGLTSMVSNYQDIVEVLKVLAATYGLVKAASIMYSVHESIMAKMDAARATIIAGKVAAIQAEIAAKEAQATASVAVVAKEASAAAAIEAIENRRVAAAAKVIAAKEASAIATTNLIAAEKAYAISIAETDAAYSIGAVSEKAIIAQKKELAAVELLRGKAQKANQAVNNAITAEIVVNSKIESTAVKLAAVEEAAAKDLLIKKDQERLIASQTATNAEVAGAAKSKIWTTLTAGANPYMLIAASIAGLFYLLSKLAPVVKTVDDHITDMNKSIDAIGKQNETDSLITKYEELEKITGKSTDQQDELNKTIKTLSSLFPNAITGTDQYGKAIGISTEKIIAQNEQLKLNLKLKTEGDLKGQQASLETLRAQQAKLLDEVNSGRYTSGNGSGFLGLKGASDIEIKNAYGPNTLSAFKILLSPEELQKRRAELIDVSAQVNQLAGKVSTVNEELSQMAFVGAESFIKANVDKFKKVTDYTRAEAIKTVDELNNLYKGDGSKEDAAIQKQSDALLAYAEKIKTTKEEVAKWNKELIEAQKQLSIVSAPGYESKIGTPGQEKSELEAVIKDLREKLGLNKKEKEAVDLLKVANEELEKAVKSGNQAAITAAAKRVDILEKEKKALEDLIELELKRAWTDSLKGQSYSTIPTIGTKPIIQVGSLKTVQGIVYEVTAIDKTGPTWKKVKLQANDLAEFAKKKAKEGADDQDKLDKETFQKKQRFQEDLLNYSRQFTDELITQLGLTEEESKLLSGFADAVASVISSDFLAAGFSAASTLMGALFSGSQKEDPTTAALEKTNALLEEQSTILSKLTLPNYLTLAKKQYEDLGVAIDLNTKKLTDSNSLFTKEQQKSLTLVKGVMDKWDFKTTGTNKEQDQALADFKLTEKFYDSLLVKYSNSFNLWTPEDFVRAYTEGTLALDNQQLGWIQGIVDAQKERAELMQETFRNALGFGTSDVADTIFQGIEDGLKLAQDGIGLGGFAQSFGDLMKKALTTAIMDATNTRITDEFLARYYKFIGVDSEGGTTLTDKEKKTLSDVYAGIIRLAEADSANIKAITDKYGTSTTSTADRTDTTKGIAASSQDSIDELNGRATAIQGHTFRIADGMDILKANSTAILSNVIEIKGHTLSMQSDMKAVKGDMKSVKDGIDTINLKGITVKY